MKRKMLLIPLVLLLIASLVAVGCAAPAPEPVPGPAGPAGPPGTPGAPAPAPAPAPVPITGPQKITWMFGYDGPPENPQIVPPMQEWARNVAARVWPEYDFELRWAFGGVIASGPDIVNAVGAGMQDVGRWIPGFSPGKTDISGLSSAPVYPEDYVLASNIMLEYWRTPFVEKELAEWNVMALAPVCFSPQEILLTFPAETLADLEGKKIRMWGIYAQIFEKAGAVPILFSIAEVYEALERGTVEGALSGFPDAFVTHHLIDVAKNVFRTGTGPTGNPVIMNSDSWDALPAKVKEAMIAEADLKGGYNKKALDAAAGPGLLKLAEAGVVVRDAPAADKAKVKGFVYEAVNEFVAELDEKGLPGSEAWATFMEIIKKHS